MKKIWQRLKSKTYWLGHAVLLLGFLEIVQNTGQINVLFDGKTQAWVTLSFAVAIYILREVTTKSLAEK